MIYGLQIKQVQDERNQHALLVRPATSSELRVYIRRYFLRAARLCRLLGRSCGKELDY